MIHYACYSIVNINIITAMIDQKQQLNYEDLETLTVIFQKVKQKINIRQIAFHIREHIIGNNDLLFKRKFLDFFLKCQSKLQLNNDEQWRRVFQQQIMKFQYAYRIYQIWEKEMKRFALQILKKKQFIISFNEIQNNLNTLYTQEYDKIEVQEEVCLKTKYFFKWSQYVENLRQMKYLQIKQQQNIKKADIFNSYAIKFQAFHQCKTFLRNQKLQRKRINTLILKQQQRIQQDIIAHIQIILQIKNIQQALTNLVQNKITLIRKSAFINALIVNRKYQLQLRNNQQSFIINKNQSNKNKHHKLHHNLWFYRFFIHQIIQSINFQENKGKSYHHFKQHVQTQYAYLLSYKVIEQLKLSLTKTKSQIIQIQQIRRFNSLKILNKLYKSIKKFNISNNYLKKKLYKKQISIFQINGAIKKKNISKQCSLLSLNRVNHYQSIIIKVCKTQQFSFKLQKINKHKIDTIGKMLVKKNSIRLIAKIVRRNKQIKVTQQKKNRIKEIVIPAYAILAHLKSKKVKKEISNQISIFREKQINILMKLALKKISYYPFFIQQEQIKLAKISEIYNNMLLQVFIYRLKQKDKQNNKINQLTQPMKKIIIKYTYNKLFSSSIKINQHISQMKMKKKIVLKQYLFNLIKKIQSNNNEIYKIFKQKLQTLGKYRFIKNIKNQLAFTTRQRTLVSIQNRIKKIQFIRKFKNKQTIKGLQSNRIKEINYLYVFKTFKQYITDKQTSYLQHQQKNKTINQYYKNLLFSTLLKHIKICKLCKKQHKQKKIELRNYFQQKKYKKIKEFFQSLIKYKNIKANQSYLIRINKKSLYRQIQINFKIHKVQKLLLTSKKSKALIHLQKLIKESTNFLSLSYNMGFKRLIKNYKINKQAKQLEKNNHLKTIQLQKLQNVNKKTQLIKMLILFKKVKNSKDKTQIMRKRNNLMIFRQKFVEFRDCMIKRKISVIHYAKKLKFKFFFQINRLYEEEKQKQNNKKSEQKNMINKIERVLEKISKE